MRGQFAKTVLRLGQLDPRLFVLVGDIGAFSMREFVQECPGRFINIGIREQAMMSAAAGIALGGMIPVVHSITPFVIERCFEQIKDDFGYQNLGGNVVSVGAGFDYSALGCTHHSYGDVAMIKTIPGSQVFYPGSPNELDALFSAAYASGKLNYFRLGGRNHSVPLRIEDIHVGKGVRVREGSDATIVTSGPLLEYAIAASDALFANSGRRCEVVYLPTIKPIDAALVTESAQKTRLVLTVEDHSVYGGLGDDVRRVLGSHAAPVPVMSIGVGERFLSDYGNFEQLAGSAGIDAGSVVSKIQEAWSNG